MHSRCIALAGILQLQDVEQNIDVEWMILRRSLQQMIGKEKPEQAEMFSFYAEGNRLAIVLCYPVQFSATVIKHESGQFLERVSASLKDAPVTIYWGKGSVGDGLLTLSASWTCALEEARQRSYAGEAPEECARKGTECGTAVLEKTYMREMVRRALQLGSAGKREESEESLRSLFDELDGAAAGEAGTTDRLEAIQNAVIEYLMENGVEVTEIEHLTEKWHVGSGKKISGVEELNSMRSFAVDCARLLQMNGRKNRFRYVEEAKDYIARHYMNNDLSLDEVSNYIGITSSYLSALFREIQKDKFISYVNCYRVEQAKVLLRTTSLSNSEIGYKCGFNSDQNFYRVFKKVAEETPSAYRDRQKEDSKT